VVKKMHIQAVENCVIVEKVSDENAANLSLISQKNTNGNDLSRTS
jgi:hypothetical protein